MVFPGFAAWKLIVMVYGVVPVTLKLFSLESFIAPSIIIDYQMTSSSERKKAGLSLAELSSIYVLVRQVEVVLQRSFHSGIRPLRSSSSEVVIICVCIHLRSSYVEVIFLWSCLSVKLSSCEWVFLWSCLPVWSSFCKVILLKCLPVSLSSCLHQTYKCIIIHLPSPTESKYIII